MMEISFGLEPVFLILTATAAGAASFLVYRRTTPLLSPGRRALLASLRFLSLFVILFLLFEPLLARLSTLVEDPVLAVLIDTSESMQLGDVEDGSGVPAATAKSLLGSLATISSLDLRYFAFDSRVRELDLESTPLDSVGFGGQRTDITAALEHVRTALAESNLTGILLLSDGRYTSGRNPRHAAEDSNVPIYTVALGDSSRRRDVRISRVATNEITYTGVELPVQIGVTANGFEGSRVVVSISVEDSTVGSTSIELPVDGTERSVGLSFTPVRPGLRQIRARISALEGEATLRNNVSVQSVRVLDRRRRVLLVGGGPDPDVAAMRHILSADANNDVLTVIQRGSNYYADPLPARFDDVDVVVLAGYPSASARREDVRRVAEAIDGGTPAIFVLSRQTDPGLFQQILSPAFGTTVSSRRQAFYEAVPIPTGAGRRHPILENISSVDAWLRLPPVSTSETPWTMAPDARVLATVRVRSVDLNDPLLAVRSQGGKRTAVFLGAGTWRLSNLPEDLSEYQNYWPDLLNNMIQWVSAAEDDRAVRVRTTTGEFAGGDLISFEGQVYDESLNPVSDADVNVVVVAPSGDEYRYAMEPIGNGRYVLDASPLAEGTYRYRAAAVRDGVEFGEDGGTFAVGNLALEFRTPAADPLLMRQISLRSGGASMTAPTFEHLPDLLASSGRLGQRVSERRSESELWRQPLFLLIVILGLATEWVLRKRSGLS